MKTTTDLKQENIRNLTSLWRTVGEKANAHTSKKAFEFGIIEYSEWPNRLWFREDIVESTLHEAVKDLIATSTRLVIPHWDIYQSNSFRLLEKFGFEKQFEQIGMSLKLSQPYAEGNELQLKPVSNLANAQLWEELFRKAFNYTISHRLLLPPYTDVSFLIAYDLREPVGTVIVHQTGDTVGIHAMGVIPEMRRKGYADIMMRKILNQAIGQGSKYATLQASAMGKGLYLKLGFKEQFVMKNYVLNKTSK